MLNNDTLKLDWDFKLSLMTDLVRVSSPVSKHTAVLSNFLCNLPDPPISISSCRKKYPVLFKQNKVESFGCANQMFIYFSWHPFLAKSLLLLEQQVVFPMCYSSKRGLGFSLFPEPVLTLVHPITLLLAPETLLTNCFVQNETLSTHLFLAGNAIPALEPGEGAR